MKKRALSMLIAMLMLMSVIPFTSATAVTFTGTTGDGSAENPLVCDTFAELKKALEYNSTEDVYIKLVANTYGFENLSGLVLGAPAIRQIGTKYLSVEGESEFIAPKNSNNDCFIEIDGTLNITGSGKLIYTHNSFLGSGAVLSLKDGDDARLIIQSNVTIYGKGSSTPEAKEWYGARALWANSGAVLINGANMYGSVSKLNFDYSYYNATELTGSVHAYLMGGVFSAIVLSNMSGYTHTPNAPAIVSLGISNLSDDASINLTGGTYFGIQHRGINTSKFVPNNYILFDDYNKKIKNGTNVLLSYMPHEGGYMYEGSFDNTLTYAPITVLRVLPPEIEEWEPFYNNGKSSMDITLLKGKQYTFKCNCEDLPANLSERGFLVKRSYILEDSTAGTTKDYYVTGTAHDIGFDYTFNNNGTAKYQVCIEVLLNDATVIKRYYTYNITVSDKESISNAEFAFDVPVVGQTPGTVAVVGGEVDYDFQGGWYEINGYYADGTPKVGNLLSSTDTFVSGKEYMATVRITLSDNLEFNSDFAGYINGNKARVFGSFSPQDRSIVLWIPYVPYEKQWYVDFNVKAPVEGDEIKVTDVAANINILTVEEYELQWIDEYGNAVSGEFIGGRNYYLKIIVLSYEDTPLLMVEKAEFRVNGEAPDRVSVGRYSPTRQAYVITKEFLCVDEHEFFFTEDSYPEAGGTMTVDIERIAEQSEELMSAYFEEDYSVQWYRDGKALEGATDLSLSFQQRDTLYTYYCELTLGDTVLTSYEFVCENHIHKYDENYEFDEEEHWHGCTDEDCPDYEGSIVGGVHSFVEGLGCSVCGYGKAIGKLGDINNDDDIDQYDYILAKRIHFKNFIPDDAQAVRGDVDKDGDNDQYDYILIKRHHFGTFVIGG